MNKGISIAIPCYNDGHLLPYLFESIEAQEGYSLPIEFILVDNGSNDNTHDSFLKYESRINEKGIALKYFYEGQRGSNYARNRGIQEATFDYVGFTDSDAKLSTDYLKILEGIIEEHQPLVISGPYLPWYNSPKPKWFKDQYNSKTESLGEGYTYGIYPSGINMIFEKKTLLAVGGFSTKLQYTKKFDRGEETEVFFRYNELKKKPYIYYSPRLMMYHYTRPASMKLFYTARSNWGMGKTHAKFNQQPQASILKMIYSLSLIFTKCIFTLLSYPFVKNKYNISYYQQFLLERVFPFVGQFSINFYFLKKKL
jgi:glycosyltransferase involved in cell wall biosynthesis